MRLVCVLLALTFSACRTAPTRALERTGPRHARVRASVEELSEAVPRAGERLGYTWHQADDARGRVELRTPPERAFFTMLGEQVRYQEAIVQVGESGGTVELQVDAYLVHGPPGGPYERKERVGEDWYRSFFDALAAEIEEREEADEAAVQP